MADLTPKRPDGKAYLSTYCGQHILPQLDGRAAAKALLWQGVAARDSEVSALLVRQGTRVDGLADIAEKHRMHVVCNGGPHVVLVVDANTAPNVRATLHNPVLPPERMGEGYGRLRIDRGRLASEMLAAGQSFAQYAVASDLSAEVGDLTGQRTLPVVVQLRQAAWGYTNPR